MQRVKDNILLRLACHPYEKVRRQWLEAGLEAYSEVCLQGLPSLRVHKQSLPQFHHLLLPLVQKGLCEVLLQYFGLCQWVLPNSAASYWAPSFSPARSCPPPHKHASWHRVLSYASFCVPLGWSALTAGLPEPLYCPELRRKTSSFLFPGHIVLPHRVQ